MPAFYFEQAADETTISQGSNFSRLVEVATEDLEHGRTVYHFGLPQSDYEFLDLIGRPSSPAILVMARAKSLRPVRS